jgi:hypothetical protein
MKETRSKKSRDTVPLTDPGLSNHYNADLISLGHMVKYGVMCTTVYSLGESPQLSYTRALLVSQSTVDYISLLPPGLGHTFKESKKIRIKRHIYREIKMIYIEE